MFICTSQVYKKLKETDKIKDKQFIWKNIKFRFILSAKIFCKIKFHKIRSKMS